MDVAWLRPPGAIWGDKAWSGWFLDLKENIRSLSDFDCVQYMSICLMLYSNNKLFKLLFILIYVVSCELLICILYVITRELLDVESFCRQIVSARNRRMIQDGAP